MGAMKAAILAITIGIFGTLALLITPSQAGPWPQRTVTFITPMAVGTAADFAARLFANALAERWGKPVIVENRPGGDMIIGSWRRCRRLALEPPGHCRDCGPRRG